jgi:hypothetical protein
MVESLSIERALYMCPLVNSCSQAPALVGQSTLSRNAVSSSPRRLPVSEGLRVALVLMKKGFGLTPGPQAYGRSLLGFAACRAACVVPLFGRHAFLL